MASDGENGKGAAPDDPPSFEAALEALEAVVARLESGTLGLEEALAAFEQGIRLARQCESRLDQAEQRVEILLREPDGSLRAEPFDPAASRGSRGDPE
ncbi:MAG TPA: exodeoxyribonuclease VII small subunit [Thermodesulfobacteriota bacterium]